MPLDKCCYKIDAIRRENAVRNGPSALAVHAPCPKGNSAIHDHCDTVNVAVEEFLSALSFCVDRELKGLLAFSEVWMLESGSPADIPHPWSVQAQSERSRR